MKSILSAFSVIFLACTLCASCGNKADGDKASDKDSTIEVSSPNDEIPMKTVKVEKQNGYIKEYNVADIYDKGTEYSTEVNKANCFFVISKREYRIYIYEVKGGDTVLVAHYPVCYARNIENKEKPGDFKTPESTMDAPFSISEIKDASIWEHDFGWGKILAYGSYFMRLVTPGHSGIGIHGSTNNGESVPGRDSEGCIRLRDTDIIRLHDLYAQTGTKVVIKAYSQAKLPFEIKAEKALGDKYFAPKPGNPVVKGEPPMGTVEPKAKATKAEENKTPEGKITVEKGEKVKNPKNAPKGKIKK